MLTQSLRKLQNDGLIVRVVSPTRPRTAHYVLTDLGLSALVPVRALVTWAEDNTGAILDARQGRVAASD